MHYAPHSKVPMHDHSAWPAAYVYLNDAGPVTFKHDGWEDPDLTRPPTKARSFRLSPTRFAGERHMVENTSDTASDFLRIEFKTMKQGEGLLHGRYPPERVPAGRALTKIKFENENARATRLIAAPRTSVTVTASGTAPSRTSISSAHARTSRSC